MIDVIDLGGGLTERRAFDMQYMGYRFLWHMGGNDGGFLIEKHPAQEPDIESLPDWRLYALRANARRKLSARLKLERGE